jgi:DNA-binding SARP family transcriptional activator
MIMFYLLGPVKVADQPSDSVISRKRVARALLATLLHHANQHVSTDRIADCVWSDPPASAHANLRTQITALRRALSDCSGGLGDRLTTRRGGPGDRAAYQLTAEPDEVDATVFTKLADHGHEQLIRQHPSEAIETLRAALHLWRGPIGEDLPDTPILRAWAAELTERRLTAGDDLAEARLQVADHTGLVATLRRRLAANPHRERTAELLIRALYASGDRPAAISAYETFRAQLVDDLGIEPSGHLQEFHIGLLKDEPVDEVPATRTSGGTRSRTSARLTQSARRAPTNRRRAPGRRLSPR